MALIICNECGNQVSDKAAFCPHCGAPVEKQQPEEPKVFCDECGIELPSGAETCPNCGAPVGKSTAMPTHTTDRTENVHETPVSVNTKPEEKQKFCAKCGTAIPESAVFCPKCGTSSIPSAGTSQAATATAYDPDPQSGIHKIVGFITLLLLALTIIGYLFGNTISTRLGYNVSVWTLMYSSQKVFHDLDIGSFDIALGTEMIIMMFVSLVAFGMIILMVIEFFTFRKDDRKYLVKMRSNWIAILVLSIIYSTLGIIYIFTLKWNEFMKLIFDYNELFYIILALSAGILITSVIMISIYTSLRKEYMRKSPDYKK